MTLARIRAVFERLMECLAVLLLTVLAAVVILGVAFRYSGHPLQWYDEVASVLLAWLTYYGAGLAALKRAHIAIPSLVRALPPPLRLLAALFGESCVLLFFGLLAWYGWVVLGYLAGQTLVTVDIPVAITQSTIPIGAALFIIAELLILPEVVREALGPAPSAAAPDPARARQG